VKYFVDANGKYLGGFDAGSLVKVPKNALEIQEPPEHAADIRKEDGTWDQTKRPVKVDPMRLAMQAVLLKLAELAPEDAALFQGLRDDLTEGA
jgi:hypothetical protein